MSEREISNPAILKNAEAGMTQASNEVWSKQAGNECFKMMNANGKTVNCLPEMHITDDGGKGFTKKESNDLSDSKDQKKLDAYGGEKSGVKDANNDGGSKSALKDADSDGGSKSALKDANTDGGSKSTDEDTAKFKLNAKTYAYSSKDQSYGQ